MKLKNGISLIVLVITIIVVAILATTAIINLSNTDIIGSASDSVEENRLANIKDVANIAYSELLLQYGGDVSLITEDILKQKMIELGIKESDLEDIIIELDNGVNVSQGQVQVGTNSSTIIGTGTSLANYTIYGNSVQNGTPTPDTPIEIQSVGDKTKNLLPFPYYSQSQDANGGKLIVNEDASVTSSGTPTAYIGLSLYKGELIKSSTNSITISLQGDCVNTNMLTTLYDDEENTLANIITRIGQPQTIDYSLYPTATSMNITYRRETNGIEMSGTGCFMVSEGTEATDYEPYGYKIPVTVRGKNLLDFSNMKLINTTDTAVRGGWEFEFSKDTDVTISYGDVETLPTATFLAKKVTDGVYGSNIQLTSDTKTISLKANEKLLVFVGSTTVESSYNMLANNGVTWIQVETGDTATEYEPYIEPITTNIYLDEPLRKVGEYKDYIDFKNQKVYRNVEVIDDTGTLTLEESYKGVVDDTGTSIELPNIHTHKGTTVIEVDTEVSPSKFVIKY